MNTVQIKDDEKIADLNSRLLKNRIIFLTGHIDAKLSDLVIAQLFFLDFANPQKDIFLYINSRGGYVNDGLAIYDTIQATKADINTVCLGSACSMAAILLAGGAKKKRYCFQHAEILIHQTAQSMSGTIDHLKIHTDNTFELDKELNKILSKHTGQSIKKITKDSSKDYFMSANEALKYGIVDKITKNIKFS